MIKKIIILLLFIVGALSGQQNDNKILTGKVEYISSQFIYVNFENTDGINIGDTLIISENEKMISKLIVQTKSSRSCATIPIKEKLNKGDEVFAIIKNQTHSNLISTEEKKNEIPAIESQEVKPISKSDYGKFNTSKDNVYGRLSVTGYSNLSNESSNENYQKWRYSLSFNADKINNSKFSFSNYITFRYRADEWNYTTSHIGDAVKIYDLALTYELIEKTNFILGRKINPKTANIGAVDGLQFETNFNKYSLGAIIGSRPNFNDYGYNINLFQMGGYVSWDDSIGVGAMQNTFSIFQQMNHGSTDRRFFYLQHTNNIVSNVYLFLSSEVDLFKKENNKNSNDFRLTSFYTSLRYSPVRWLSANASYDARKNVIYYETFKNYADQLIESALRQGFRLRLNLRPINYVFVSLYSGYRFRDSDIRPSRNFGGSITHSRIPYLRLSANLNFIGLNTSYLDGNIIGLRLTKDLFDGLVNATLGYRKV
ncbi:MAG: hypothetical protein KDC90_11610, partial [Ignavibacteriae bacterium]|nr:hypothetical protein [Ignavibacteriota bacterium]